MNARKQSSLTTHHCCLRGFRAFAVHEEENDNCGGPGVMLKTPRGARRRPMNEERDAEKVQHSLTATENKQEKKDNWIKKDGSHTPSLAPRDSSKL